MVIFLFPGPTPGNRRSSPGDATNLPANPHPVTQRVSGAARQWVRPEGGPPADQACPVSVRTEPAPAALHRQAGRVLVGVVVVSARRHRVARVRNTRLVLLGPVYIKHQNQCCDNSVMMLSDTVLIENNGVTWKWVATPFWSDSTIFNENSIANIIAELLQLWLWHFV